MPWLAVPFEARSAQAAMASRFKVQGIPALVLIENGEVINASARGAVMKDPTGADFPWRGQENQAGCAPHWHILPRQTTHLTLMQKNAWRMDSYPHLCIVPLCRAQSGPLLLLRRFRLAMAKVE